jgi:hypothetical protein
MFPGAGAVSERVPQETGTGRVGGSPLLARLLPIFAKSPISLNRRVLFQDYGLAPLRKAALLARKLVWHFSPVPLL